MQDFYLNKTCKKCAKKLSPDEIGIHRRLVDMQATDFFCIECLSKYFGCSIEIINKKIEQYKKLGCGLFPEEKLL